MKSRTRRIIVGDIHGELAGLLEILRHAGLIDSRADWKGGSATLIQTGDVIDRGPYSIESLDLLRKLQRQAPETGGQVVRICGNHELMLLEGNYFYVNFSDPDRHADELRQEILSGAVRAAYFDGERLYTHAGLRTPVRRVLEGELLGEMPEQGAIEVPLPKLTDHINSVLARSIGSGDLTQHPIFHVDRVRGGSYMVGGIFWGDYSQISPYDDAWTVPQVFGHTPTRTSAVAHDHDLKLIDVDAGLCRVYGGHRVYLEIDKDGRILEIHKEREQWVVNVLGKEETIQSGL